MQGSSTVVEQRDPETYAIIGAALEVHKVLGQGFLEPVYQAALQVEFERRGIAYRREVDIPIVYKEEVLPCFYRADFICDDSIIVELKAIQKLTNIEHAQVINYLKATGYKRGLLINFGASSLEYKRFVS